MAHNTRRLTDAGTVIGTSADLADAFRDIDETTTKALNGADGGTFTAASGITIAGAGAIFACPVDLNSAPIVITSSAPLTLGANHAADHLRLAAGHTGSARTLRQWLGPAVAEQVNYCPSWSDDIAIPSVKTRYAGAKFASRLRVHNGGELLQVVVRWKVAWTHAALPAFVPKFRVVRVDTDGVTEPLRAGVGLASDGFIQLPDDYSSLVAYEAGNAQQNSASYVCDQNNVVDVSRYEYFVEIVEEDGANAFPDSYSGGPDEWATDANIFYWAEVTMDNIEHMGPQ